MAAVSELDQEKQQQLARVWQHYSLPRQTTMQEKGLAMFKLLTRLELQMNGALRRARTDGDSCHSAWHQWLPLCLASVAACASVAVCVWLCVSINGCHSAWHQWLPVCVCISGCHLLNDQLTPLMSTHATRHAPCTC